MATDRCVVDAVTHHQCEVAPLLQIADIFQLSFRRQAGIDLVYAQVLANIVHIFRAVAADNRGC